MNQLEHIDAAWHIDPATVRRLWPVIDVYGRITRALAGSDQDLDTQLERLSGRGSAA
ncbi:MAG: hypothetical protein AB7W59_18780 [Acidimicrobiia bacterium]